MISILLTIWSMMLSKHSHKPIPTLSSHEPDAFMENVVATIMNKQGKPAIKITSPKMFHFQDQDTTEIAAPHIIVYRDSPEPWHIHSDFAKATQGLEQIVFWSHVIIRHEKDSTHPATTMRTESLTVFPSQQIAKTKDPITFTQPATTVYGIGMLANMNQGTIKLLSETRGNYVPAS